MRPETRQKPKTVICMEIVLNKEVIAPKIYVDIALNEVVVSKEDVCSTLNVVDADDADDADIVKFKITTQMQVFDWRFRWCST